MKSIRDLYKTLNYTFKDIALLNLALRHRSAKGQSNERLEFLGDSILNFVIAQALFERFPQAKEGELSRMRANLVKGDTLAEIATDLEIGDHLNLGSGELKSGGNRRRSILADSVESIIAAIYFDANLAICRQCILGWFENRLEKADALQTYKDAKTMLQEYLQARRLSLPSYEVMKIEGEAHEQIFYIACSVDGLTLTAEGQGASRRTAEQEAASGYLQKLILQRENTNAK